MMDNTKQIDQHMTYSIDRYQIRIRMYGDGGGEDPYDFIAIPTQKKKKNHISILALDFTQRSSAPQKSR